MASIPILTVVEQSLVSPPPATVGNTSLALSYIDMYYVNQPPIHYLFFYELSSLTKTRFIETIIPSLKLSLSITLQHFYPFAGNLIVYPTTTINPEIRFVEGDSVKVTSAECNLDFNDLTGYHPRNCDKFYHLIPLLGDYARISDYMKIPVFSLQVTYFPNCGISIGMTFHHSLGDASTEFCFLKAWTSIARCGTDESFLATGTLPFYERVVNHPERHEFFLRLADVEALFDEEFKPPKLSVPTNKVRATFVLTRKIIDQLKKTVSTQLPTLTYVSSLTVTCAAYIWCCLAKARNADEQQAFLIPVDARGRLNPPIPACYFGNCITASMTLANTSLLKGNEGFMSAIKLMGDNLHEMLTDKDGILTMKYPKQIISEGMSKTSMIAIAGTPKLRFYDMDFGWGKPKKLEKISLDYGASISIEACQESNQDMEVGIVLTATQMKVFVTTFNQELEPYI